MLFAIVTPSYHVDFPRCQMLNASILKYLPERIVHYIIVDERDVAAFGALKSERTRILVQEELVPYRFYRPNWAPRWRLSFDMLPIRGWIWQQIIKLSIADHIQADAFMMVDSDCMFIRQFDPHTLIRGDLVPLFREEKDYYAEAPDSVRWHRYAGNILRIERPLSPYRTGYVGPHVFWRKDMLKKLIEHLEVNTEKPWFTRIASCPTFSEYVAYGMFVEHVVGVEQSGHYKFDREIVHNYWLEVPMTEEQTKTFARELPPHCVMIHINGKSRTPIESIRKCFPI